MTEGPFGMVWIAVFMEKVERRESEPARKREVRSRSHKNRGSRRLRQFLALCRGDTEVRRNAACQHLAVGNPGDTLRDGDLQEQNTGRKRNQNGASYSRSAVLPRDISVPAFFLFFFSDYFSRVYRFAFTLIVSVHVCASPSWFPLAFFLGDLGVVPSRFGDQNVPRMSIGQLQQRAFGVFLRAFRAKRESEKREPTPRPIENAFPHQRDA